MPGAFAHITSIHVAAANNSLMKLNIPKQAKKVLSQNKSFIELGCVSPDYPYLAILDSAQNKWADEMHYTNIGGLITELIALIKVMEGREQDKAFAWLCGFVAHVAADITIHPVVELKVGPYAENAKQHRICEMNQDAYIWPKRMGLGEVGYADRVRDSLGSCVDSENPQSLDLTILTLWRTALINAYPDYAQQCQPDINAWHHGFQTVVDKVEEGHHLFAWARHVAAKHGLTYPRQQEVDTEFIENLATPDGDMHYDAVFDKAIHTIHCFWEQLCLAVFDQGPTDFFKNWNLDTGLCENNRLTAWEEL